MADLRAASPVHVHPGHDLGDVCVDVGATGRVRDRHLMVAVAGEVQLADAQQVNRRERLAAAGGSGNLLPAAPGAPRGRTEAAIEVPPTVHRASDCNPEAC